MAALPPDGYRTSTTAVVYTDSTEITGWSGTYTIIYQASPSGYFEPEVEPERVNLTDWRGLALYARGFVAKESVCRQVHRVIRRPGGDWHHKRKLRMQRMRE